MIYKLKSSIPNIITTSRIISLTLGFIFFINDKILLSIALYIYGAISDALDGYFARKYSAYTKFGKYLDAVSDKLYFLSLILILLIYKYYVIIIPFIMELTITAINYLIIRNNKKVFTERVGKFKTTLLMINLISGVISIKIKIFTYVFIIILPLVLYFEMQTIFAYINQLHNKSKEVVINNTDKKINERIKILLQEFIYYIKKPIILK